MKTYVEIFVFVENLLRELGKQLYWIPYVKFAIDRTDECGKAIILITQ